MWAVGQVAFPYQADGSFIHNAKGQVVGSALIGQEFLDKSGNPLPQYFQPRPSAAEPARAGGIPPGDSTNTSGATNLGPGDPRLVGFIPGLNTVDLNGNTSSHEPLRHAGRPLLRPDRRQDRRQRVQPAHHHR